MQQVRALGRMPKENHDPKEGRLAHDLRKARAAGLMTSYEPELRELEIKDAEAVAASTAAEHAQRAEAMMQQVRALGLAREQARQPRSAERVPQARNCCYRAAHVYELPDELRIRIAVCLDPVRVCVRDRVLKEDVLELVVEQANERRINHENT